MPNTISVPKEGSRNMDDHLASRGRLGRARPVGLSTRKLTKEDEETRRQRLLDTPAQTFYPGAANKSGTSGQQQHSQEVIRGMSFKKKAASGPMFKHDRTR